MVTNLTKRTPKKRKPENNGNWQDDFLTLLAEGGVVEDACMGAGISKTTAYNLRRENADFAKAWDKAVQVALSILKDEAFRRAKSKSDTLLIFLLKAHDPMYRDKIELGLSADIMALLPQLQAAAKEAGFDLKELLEKNIEALKAGE